MAPWFGERYLHVVTFVFVLHDSVSSYWCNWLDQKAFYAKGMAMAVMVISDAFSEGGGNDDGDYDVDGD